jgi:hypothetical protein
MDESTTGRWYNAVPELPTGRSPAIETNRSLGKSCFFPSNLITAVLVVMILPTLLVVEQI